MNTGFSSVTTSVSWTMPYFKYVGRESMCRCMSHAEMKGILIQNEGMFCKGCLRKFDDERFLNLDHNTPRSDGRLNHISNRLLLCSPCNHSKSNTLTLSGLRQLNHKNGCMGHG